jgi:lysophospholipase L1-like esterase
MSLRWFGGRVSNALVYNPTTGRPMALDSGTVWLDAQRTTQVTALVDSNQAPIVNNTIRTDDYGYMQQFGIDTATATERVWVDFTAGLGPLVVVECNDRATYRIDATAMQAAITASQGALPGLVAPLVSTEVVAQGTALWTPNKRRLGLLTDCVIVGSSNALTSTWAPEFCATWGLTQRNFAVGGSGFTSSSNFLSQLQVAAADVAFANDNVALVVICDASNNIREWNNTGTTRDVTVDAKAAFSYARTTFPRARIVCIPVVWPADPVANVANVPGGYQLAWSLGLAAVVQQIQDAAFLHNVEVVDQSWTWLTGLTGVMSADGSVHPNAAGYTMVAQWLSKHLRGEITRKDTAWVAVPYLNAQGVSGAAPLRWRREGWTVFVNGSIQNTVAGASGYTDLAKMPVGIRPTYGWELTARANGATASSGLQLYADGTMRLWTALAVNSQYFMSGTLTLS